jgi:protein ImuA
MVTANAVTGSLRPESSRHQASAAPLRLLVRSNQPWSLQLELLKRRGPAHSGLLELPAIPPSLQAVLPARLLPGNAPLSPIAIPIPATAIHLPDHDSDLGRAAAPPSSPSRQRARPASLQH